MLSWTSLATFGIVWIIISVQKREEMQVFDSKSRRIWETEMAHFYTVVTPGIVPTHFMSAGRKLLPKKILTLRSN